MAVPIPDPFRSVGWWAMLLAAIGVATASTVHRRRSRPGRPAGRGSAGRAERAGPRSPSGRSNPATVADPVDRPTAGGDRSESADPVVLLNTNGYRGGPDERRTVIRMGTDDTTADRRLLATARPARRAIRLPRSHRRAGRPDFRHQGLAEARRGDRVDARQGCRPLLSSGRSLLLFVQVYTVPGLAMTSADLSVAVPRRPAHVRTCSHCWLIRSASAPVAGTGTPVSSRWPGRSRRAPRGGPQRSA